MIEVLSRIKRFIYIFLNFHDNPVRGFSHLLLTDENTKSQRLSLDSAGHRLCLARVIFLSCPVMLVLTLRFLTGI